MRAITLPNNEQVSDEDFVIVKSAIKSEKHVYRVKLSEDGYNKITDVEPSDEWIEARQSAGDDNPLELTRVHARERERVEDWFQEHYPSEDYEYDVRSKSEHVAQEYLGATISQFKSYLSQAKENIFGRN